MPLLLRCRTKHQSGSTGGNNAVHIPLRPEPIEKVGSHQGRTHVALAIRHTLILVRRRERIFLATIRGMEGIRRFQSTVGCRRGSNVEGTVDRRTLELFFGPWHAIGGMPCGTIFGFERFLDEMAELGQDRSCCPAFEAFDWTAHMEMFCRSHE
mmetsp:Transcript_22350/g.31480  ORF Transcript_22350/g.31480 Transcript_22350/m.31480 type:complete len:154 (+) Transcript_22350:297-758(+)